MAARRPAAQQSYNKDRVVFVDCGRGLAALLVVYTHITDQFLYEFKHTRTPATDAVDAILTDPLKLDVQGVGAVAVPFFFLASGFVVTPIALRLRTRRFTVNRLFRIYPPLIFAVLLAVLLIVLGTSPLSTDPRPVTLGSILSNISLANFFQGPLGAYVGVAWTLVVEVLFYVLLVALLPLLRRSVWLTITIELELIFIALLTHEMFGLSYSALAVNAAYVTMPVVGQVIWAAWHRYINVYVASLFTLAAWCLFVFAGHLDIHPDYIPRPFPFAVALVLFLLGLFAEDRLAPRRTWTELSDRTYSIYLLHGVVAFPVLHVTFESLPASVSILLALLLTAVTVETGYRIVERPSHQLGRWLSRRQSLRRGMSPPDEFDRDNRATGHAESSPAAVASSGAVAASSDEAVR